MQTCYFRAPVHLSITGDETRESDEYLGQVANHPGQVLEFLDCPGHSETVDTYMYMNGINGTRNLHLTHSWKVMDSSLTTSRFFSLYSKPSVYT